MRKIKLIQLLTLILLIVAFVAIASPVLAQQSIKPAPITGLPGGTGQTVPSMIRFLIIAVLLPIAGLVAVLFIIIGGFQYIVSGANEELAETGKKTLRHAIIGLVIIILSYIMVIVIFNALSVP